MREKRLKPIHPGEVLQEEFLKPIGLSQHHLAMEIGVPARRINEIVLGMGERLEREVRAMPTASR